MKIQKVILTETKHISIGVLAGDVLMCLVFVIIGKFDYTVVLGALLGSFFACGNFFLMGVSIQKALEKGDGAKKYMYSSYTVRMLLYALCVIIGAVAPCFQTAAVIIPLFFPQLVIYAMRAFGYRAEDGSTGPSEMSQSDLPSSEAKKEGEQN